MPRKAKETIIPYKIVLFVEGEITTDSERHPDPFKVIWQQRLVDALGLATIDRIVAINKKNLVKMNEEAMPQKRLSGTGMIGLDLRIAVELAKESFDVALVAWDLLPAWNSSSDAGPCRWEEVLKLYGGLAKSRALESPWKDWCERRFEELSARKHPSQRTRPLKLERGAVLSLCMEPTFESLLMVCERTVLELLGVVDRGRVDWPDWSIEKHRPEDVLQLAIAAGNRIRPKARATTLIRGDMKTEKHAWGEYILRQMIQDPDCSERLKQHPISRRLVELLSRPIDPATLITPPPSPPSAPRATSGRPRPR